MIGWLQGRMAWHRVVAEEKLLIARHREAGKQRAREELETEITLPEPPLEGPLLLTRFHLLKSGQLSPLIIQSPSKGPTHHHLRLFRDI